MMCAMNMNNHDNDGVRHDVNSDQQPHYHAKGSNSTSSRRLTIPQRCAVLMARWPKTCLWTFLLMSVVGSGLGLYYGDFSVTLDKKGWLSRGSLIADRHQQTMLVRTKRDDLFTGDNDIWEELTTTVQPGWETTGTGRRLSLSSFSIPQREDSNDMMAALLYPRKLQVGDGSNETDPDPLMALIDQCDVNFYFESDFYSKSRLWPKWKVKQSKPSTSSALDPEVLHELCVAERNTQQVLEERGLCFGCNNGGCLPPYSVVLMARLTVKNGFSLSCRELADAWGPYQAKTEKEWRRCVAYMKTSGGNGMVVSDEKNTDKNPCHPAFTGALVDEFFDATGNVRYTSSIFVSRDDITKELYDVAELYDRGGEFIEGAYDTQKGDFIALVANEVLPRDMILAIGSAVITAIAMVVHTRSLYLTLVGLVEITMSFPMAFCIYKFLGGISSFPFLNFIGIFVVFALGADHVFVAVDKWKNARLAWPEASTEEIAIKALPDAAGAMLLTTITTAVAFFGSAFCPVGPVRLFGIFCGLLIIIDYILDVLIFFPALCIYDGYRNRMNCLVSFEACKSTSRSASPVRNDNDGRVEHENQRHEDRMEEEEQKPSLIRRILAAFYKLLHALRWPLLLICIGAICLCSYYATKLKQPFSNEIQLLRSDVEVELANKWSSKLLYDVLSKQTGSNTFVMFGVKPADTGDRNNPDSWTSLALDETFDPSTEAAQIYLRDYCDRFLAQDFAELTPKDYICPINRFDRWLQGQAESDNPDETYSSSCSGETGMPLSSPDSFHSCLSAWAKMEQEQFIMSRDGIVKIIHFTFTASIMYDSPNNLIQKEWHRIEDWMKADRATAPPEVSHSFFSSTDFWFWDSSYQLYISALQSAALALGASAVVILISSRSFVMTIFSVVSVAYVLTSVTALMVAFGWELGLLECICFTILIGVSVDFVIHFSHAYTEQPGNIDRHERTKTALIHMGPSILAAAFTTLASAIIMLFTVIQFFRLFAAVLIFTIVQAIVGSFVVFLTLTDTLGPSNPRLLLDLLTKKCCKGGAESPDSLKIKSVETDDANCSLSVDEASVPHIPRQYSDEVDV